MLAQDFILSQLIELLPASDIHSMFTVSHFCHDYLLKEIRKVIVGDENPFYRYHSFRLLVIRNIGDTEVRIPVLSSSLMKIKNIILMDTIELLTKVDRFFIRLYQSKDFYTDTLYSGKYIAPKPKIENISRLDVCSMWGVWKSAIFLRREDDYIVVRFLWHNKEVRIHHLSPRISPQFYQITGGGSGGGPIYQ